MDKPSTSGKGVKRKAVKGGAEKLREKKKKALEEQAKFYKPLSSFIKLRKENVEGDSQPAQSTSTTPIEPVEAVQLGLKQPTTSTILEDVSSQQKVSEQEFLPPVESNNFFSIPATSDIDSFFKFHPIQPCDVKDLPFNPITLFRRKSGVRRTWLTYNEHSKTLFCTVCMVYSKESSIFKSGVKSIHPKHIYSRVDEHEKSQSHKNSAEAHLMQLKKLNILSYVPKQENIRLSQVQNRRDILLRIIEVIKVIGKCGIAYRGHRNEDSLSFPNSKINRGNFLELILLLKKFDPLLIESGKYAAKFWEI